MLKLISELIFSKKIITPTLKILIRNETSITLFIKPELVIIKEFKEDGVVLQIPPKICQKSHNLTLFFFKATSIINSKPPITGHYKEADFEFVGKVLNVETEDKNNNNSNVIIDLKFSQYDVSDWRSILNLFENYQEQLTANMMSQHKIRKL